MLSSLSRPSIRANIGGGSYGTCWICLEARRAFSSPIYWRMALQRCGISRRYKLPHAAIRTAASVEANVHEHIARVMYYFSVHLLYASIVGAAAWVLTSIRGASATTKYWIWVLTAFNFIMPTGAIVDKLWAPHLAWAAPIGTLGDPIWDITEGVQPLCLLRYG
jgi:hypothetical protein